MRESRTNWMRLARIRRVISAAVMAIAATVASLPASADVLIGGGETGANSFPFRGPAFGSIGSVYQQVYDASQFSGSIGITGIRFFAQGSPVVRAGTYTFSLSTTSAAVDALSLTFNNNLGGDNQQFFSGALGGAVAANLTVFGTAFNYDPTAGNLLLDIRVSNASATLGSGGFQSRNSNPGGPFSRAQNFGSGNAGFGLTTEFLTAAGPAIPEPGTFALIVTGLAGLGMMRRRRRDRELYK